MRVRINQFGEVISQHLPPVDQSLLLRIDQKGRVRAIEMYDTPVDDNGIPVPDAYIQLLASTLHEDYVPPTATDVHHLVSNRAQYAQFGKDSVQNRFRESASLMVDVQMQIHRYGHWVLHPIKMPRYEIMEQYNTEQDQITSLFMLGRAAINPSRWRSLKKTDDFKTLDATFLHGLDVQPTAALFFDALDEAEDGQLGLMPDRQMLADLGLAEATRRLGVLAGARALSYHRKTLETIKSTPI